MSELAVISFTSFLSGGSSRCFVLLVLVGEPRSSRLCRSKNSPPFDGLCFLNESSNWPWCSSASTATCSNQGWERVAARSDAPSHYYLELRCCIGRRGGVSYREESSVHARRTSKLTFDLLLGVRSAAAFGEESTEPKSKPLFGD